MIITLKGANFSANNIGNINTNPIEALFNAEWIIGRTFDTDATEARAEDARYVALRYPRRFDNITIINPKPETYYLLIARCNDNGVFASNDKTQLSSATWNLDGNLATQIKFFDDRVMTEEAWQTIKAEILAANQ